MAKLADAADIKSKVRTTKAYIINGLTIYFSFHIC